MHARMLSTDNFLESIRIDELFDDLAHKKIASHAHSTGGAEGTCLLMENEAKKKDCERSRDAKRRERESRTTSCELHELLTIAQPT